MVGGDEGDESQKIVIAESDFNLANYSQPNQLTERIFVTPVDDPGLFKIAEGEDFIEIVVKTVVLGDSDTPGSTMSRPPGANNTRNSRNSMRRGTVMQTMPFIPQSPSNNEMTPVTPGSQRSVESGTTRFSFAGLSAAQHEMKSSYQEP